MFAIHKKHVIEYLIMTGGRIRILRNNISGIWELTDDINSYIETVEVV